MLQYLTAQQNHIIKSIVWHRLNILQNKNSIVPQIDHCQKVIKYAEKGGLSAMTLSVYAN